MEKGINLASRPIRHGVVVPLLGGLVLLAALAGTTLHVVAWQGWTRSARDLRGEVERLDRRREALEAELEGLRRELAAPPAARIVKELVAVERSGAARAVAPVDILAELAAVMPAEAWTLSLRLEASAPEPELEVEAVARSAGAAADLVSGLSRSPFVSRAEIVEERHEGDSSITLRLLAALRGRGVRK